MSVLEGGNVSDAVCCWRARSYRHKKNEVLWRQSGVDDGGRRGRFWGVRGRVASGGRTKCTSFLTVPLRTEEHDDRTSSVVRKCEHVSFVKCLTGAPRAKVSMRRAQHLQNSSVVVGTHVKHATLHETRARSARSFNEDTFTACPGCC